jgi:hypothetical protein
MRIVLWGAFFLFVAIAMVTNWDRQLIQFDSATGIARLVLIAVWFGFIAYSIYCSRKENFFRAVGKINQFHWGRQIGIDLYISVFMSIALVYLVTGSIVQALLWSLAFIPFANLAILLFVILHLDEIVAAFTTGSQLL